MHLRALTSLNSTTVVGAGTLINAAASYGQLALTGRALSREAGASFSVLWAIVFSVGIGLFFPLEQDLTRAVADRRARGIGTAPLVRRGMTGSLGLACAALVLLGLVSGPLAEALFAGDIGLVAALGGALVGLACAHGMRGVLAGLGAFPGYGAQLVVDAVLRLALTGALTATAAGSARAYALVLTAAPVLASLALLPTALRRTAPGPRPLPAEIGAGVGFLIVSALLAQAVANAPVVTVRLLAPDRAALASALLCALMLVRIPQFLVASLQASMLVRLTHARTRHDAARFRQALLIPAALVTGVACGWTLLCASLGPTAQSLLAAEPLLHTADFLLLGLGSTGFLLAFLLGNATLATGRRGIQLLAWSCGSCLLPAAPVLCHDALRGAELAFTAAAWTAALILLVITRSLLSPDAPEVLAVSDTPARSPSHTPPGMASATADASYTRRLVELERQGLKRLLPVQAPYRWNLRRLRLGRVLDVGCGVGRNLAHCASGSLGVDHNPSSVTTARARGLDACTPQEFLAGPHATPGAFDSLLSAHVLEHLAEGQAEELLRTYLPYVREGGSVVLITPQEAGYRSDATHQRFVDFTGLRTLAKSHGLTVRRTYSFPFPRAAGKHFKYNEFVLVGTT